MNSKTIMAVNVVLLLVSIFMVYKIYQIIMEPIEFERIKFVRKCDVTERMEQVRDAEMAYKAEFGEFTGDFSVLAAFVDTGRVTIYERKDSSFIYYNKLYQKDMSKDTVITRVIGHQKVSDKFGPGFEGRMLAQVPHTDGSTFELGAGKISRNGVTVPVFEVSVPETVIFADLKSRFDQYINKTYSYTIGSLTEASVSGNYENTDCKKRDN